MVKKNFHLDEDVRLMLKVANGDEDAFNKIYKKYFQIVTDYATSVNRCTYSSEDIANEVFKRVWQQRDKYKPTSKVKTYLFAFSRNVILEYQRQSRYQRSLLNNCFQIMVEQSAAEVVVQDAELIEIIEAVKSKLSEKQLQAVEFIFYSNISINEAAKLAGCSNTVFYGRVKDAKKRLSVLLKQFQDY
jgi:RNA polymerase sigma-70 factor (ECF subfamily)